MKEALLKALFHSKQIKRKKWGQVEDCNKKNHPVFKHVRTNYMEVKVKREFEH